MPDDQNHRAVVSWRDYVDTRLGALEKAAEASHVAMEKATIVAQTAIENRLASMNEIRETMRDQATRMATRAELGIAQDAIEKDLRALREFRAELQGKASQSQVNVALLLAVLGPLLSVALWLLGR